MAGSSLQKVVGSAAKPVTPLMFGVSGRQFFLADGADDREPVLVRASSVYDEGQCQG